MIRVGRAALAAGTAAASIGAARLATTESQSAATAAATLTESITLPDGRMLSYRATGDPAGVPVFALHGMGSSHRTWATQKPLSELVEGVLLIAVDRPGYGDSSPPPAAYSYSQSAHDLAHLADVLGFRRFAVAGHSSGGPYALAAAAVLPERVLACAAISSDPPYAHPKVPASVRASDDMSHDASAGGFYGVDPLVKVSKWREKDVKNPEKPDKRHAWKQGVVGCETPTDWTVGARRSARGR